MLKIPELFINGFHKTYFTMGDDIREMVRQEDWNKVDQTFKDLTKENGRLYNFLKEFHDFSSIEFIISLRDSTNDWEEDGIGTMMDHACLLSHSPSRKTVRRLKGDA